MSENDLSQIGKYKKNDLPIITEDSWKNAIKEISNHLQNIGNDKVLISNSIGNVYKDITYDKMSIKRVNVNACSFENCFFIKSAGTGSRYIKSVFNDCKFEDCNFQYSNFQDSVFYSSEGENLKTIILGTNLGGGNFDSVKMEKIEIIGSSFSQVNFSNAFIKNCSISSCTFEGAIFKNANLENLNLSSLNIEYADFYDTNFKNVYLPIMQLPYTFGGLINFFNKEGILIKTNQINHPSKNLSTLEYKKLLPSLEIYFLKMNEFFPLANIYLARKEFDKFDDAIQHGIKLGFLNKDFRIIKHLCKLVVKSSIYSVHQLKSIYVLINELGKSNSNDKKVFHEYSLHLGEIQTILFSSIDEDSVEISFRLEDKTKSNEIDMFNAVLKEIEAGINCVIGNSNWYYLQIQKNSPLEVILKYLPDSFETAILIIFACGYLLKQSTNFIKDILEIKEKKKKLTEKEKEKIENELNNRRNNILNINVNINNIYISNSQNIFLNSDNIDYLN